MKPSSRGRRQKQGLLTSLSQLKILKGLHWRWWMQLRRDSTPLIQSLKGKSCPNSLVVSWSMTLYATCLWFWRKLEGTKTHVTQAGSAEMISHATPMLPSLCVDVLHTRKSTLLVRVFTVSGKSSKRKKTIILVSFDELRDICSTLSVKTSHRTSRYLCIATLLESSVQCHVHIGEIFAFYGLHHILCYIMSEYCATTHLGFQ